MPSPSPPSTGYVDTRRARSSGPLTLAPPPTTCSLALQSARRAIDAPADTDADPSLTYRTSRWAAHTAYMWKPPTPPIVSYTLPAHPSSGSEPASPVSFGRVELIQLCEVAMNGLPVVT